MEKRTIALASIALIASLAFPASAQTGSKFGKAGGVGAADSTYSDSKTTGGKFATNDQTGITSFKGVTLTPQTNDPATPPDGRCWWSKLSGLFCRFNGVTTGPFIAPTQAGKFLSFGDLYGTPYDGVSSSQAYFGQTQPVPSPVGTFGAALYGQRVASYSGGAASWANVGINSAIRGYNNIGANTGIAVESGGVFVSDLYSNTTQGLGLAGTLFNHNGGPGWGAVFEIKELPRTYTAKPGETVFNVAGGFDSVALVTKNGAPLSRSQYALSTPAVTLASPTIAGDVLKVYVSDPRQGQLGQEIDVTAGFGSDGNNATAGNRQGLAIVARRDETSFNIVSHVGSALNIYCSPGDPNYLICDRGMNFEGQLSSGIDFSASNATFSNYLLKFNASGAGVTAAGNLAIGNVGTNDITGVGTVRVGNTSGGGLVRVGDTSHILRLQGSNSAGLAVGSETNDDLILLRQNAEKARITPTAFQSMLPVRLTPTTFAALPACSSASEGSIAYINDASDAISTWHQQVSAGGGANKAFVACNGTGWFAFDN